MNNFKILNTKNINFQITNVNRINFRKDINGLRALAVVSVILYHLDVEYFKGGYLGVDLFFVISGYLISNIIFSELKEDNFSFKKFYIRRARRILPAVLSTIVITFPFALYFLLPLQTVEYLNSILSTLFFFANIYFSKLDFYNAEPTDFMPFLHTWSLGVEEQFYLIFPVLIIFLYRYFKKQLFWLLVSIFIFSIYLNMGSSFLKFYLIQYRFWQLLAGVLVCVLSSKFRIKNLDLIGIPIILLSILNFGDNYILEIEPRIFVTIGTIFVIFSENTTSYFEKFSSLKLINNLGLTSFSLYLLHQPIFAFARIHAYRQNIFIGNISDPNYFAKETFNSYIPICLILLFVLSNLNFQFIERKFIQGELNIRIVFYTFLIILLVSLIGLLDDGYSYRYDHISSDLIELQDSRTNSLIIDGDSCFERNIEEICIIDRKERTSIYNFGDSHASTLSLYLASNLESYNFIDLTGCIKYIDHLSTSKECLDRGYDIESYNNYLKFIKNSIVIYFIDSTMEIKKFNFEDFDNQVSTTLNRILENNNKLLLVYPVPQYDIGIPLQIIQKNLDINSTVSMDYLNFLNNEEISFTYLTYDKFKNKNIYRIYPEKVFCDTFIIAECVGAINGTLYYYDESHLAKDGAELIGLEIVKTIKDLD